MLGELDLHDGVESGADPDVIYHREAGGDCGGVSFDVLPVLATDTLGGLDADVCVEPGAARAVELLLLLLLQRAELGGVARLQAHGAQALGEALGRHAVELVLVGVQVAPVRAP